MTDAQTDISGWKESADVITEGGDKPCAERMFIHDCGATLKLFSGWGEEVQVMEWWWEVVWRHETKRTESSFDPKHPPTTWARGYLRYWGAIRERN